METHIEDIGQHNKRVADMMYQFAIANNFSFQDAQLFKLACILNDLGNVAVPDEILIKPTKLTDKELEIVKEHTKRGFDISGDATIPVLKTAAEIAQYHHEWFDGTGYTDGLEGLNIPLGSLMMAIVDVFDPVLADLFVSQLISILKPEETKSVE